MSVPAGPSIHLYRLFSAVRWVPDEALVGRIDDEIEQPQGNLADEYGRALRKFDDVDLAFSALNGQVHSSHKLETRQDQRWSAQPGIGTG